MRCILKDLGCDIVALFNLGGGMNTICCVSKITNAVSFIVYWKKLMSYMMTLKRIPMNWGISQGCLVKMLRVLVFNFST